MSSALGLSALPEARRSELVSVARDFVFAKADYRFTPEERRVLEPFFTNLDQRVFFMHSLPSNVMATLASMFSRLKNRRGIRGVFVDAFLPGILASMLPELSEDDGVDVEAFLREKNISNLRQFIGYSRDAAAVFEWFAANAPDKKYVRLLADSKKAKKFLGMYLDQYGHNSIARMGEVWLCFERVSILTAKSVEWTRPGVGYVELSTRFVDMKSAEVYPIENELAFLEVSQSAVRNNVELLFKSYRELQGEKLDGLFPQFLREKWGGLVQEAGGKVELGVSGETFDVLGNLLPASTLTSVAVAVSGESLPSILKHLILDDTAENLAVVELVIQEASKIGADQFIRHLEPSFVDTLGWQYMLPESFGSSGFGMEPFRNVPDSHTTAQAICESMGLRHDFYGMNIETLAAELFKEGRKDHDKLPRDFEVVTVPFRGVMSFRSWRDLHRQGFSTHRRTPLTPYLGFYEYDKPAPSELVAHFFLAEQRSADLYRRNMYNVPPLVLQYILPIGFNVGFIYSANLRQHEFCDWQRTKPSVNHEVRQIFLSVEKGLRRLYPWWPLFSRADMTPAYVFARGSAVQLP